MTMRTMASVLALLALPLPAFADHLYEEEWEAGGCKYKYKADDDGGYKETYKCEDDGPYYRVRPEVYVPTDDGVIITHDDPHYTAPPEVYVPDNGVIITRDVPFER